MKFIAPIGAYGVLRLFGLLHTPHAHLNPLASKDTLSMQFQLSMKTGREVALERSEGAGDRKLMQGVISLMGEAH